MLTIDRLRAGYGKTVVVDDLSLALHRGEVVALVGRNGVGKTTLLRAMFGQCDVVHGSVSMEGSLIAPGKLNAPARAGMTLMPDDRGVFPTLTVEENLRLAERSDYTPGVDVRALYPLLTDRSDELAGNLSGGQKQQVGIARAILAGKKFIAIDELSQGLQPSVAQDTLAALRTLAAQDIAVLFVEQSPKYPLAYADRIVGMMRGTVVLDEPTQVLRDHADPLTELLTVG